MRQFIIRKLAHGWTCLPIDSDVSSLRSVGVSLLEFIVTVGFLCLWPSLLVVNKLSVTVTALDHFKLYETAAAPN